MEFGKEREYSPGPIVLFGSGETSPSGRKIFESVFRRLPEGPLVALLETPAGFELNSSEVIGRVGDFIAHRLRNYRPQVVIIPARKRGTEFSPEHPAIVEPVYSADMIFMGPGSPTYAVRQLKGSLAWGAILARHRLGAALVLASAAVVAISAYALPVYEIYKVGEELHWKQGLNLFSHYGLRLVFVPHWNNNDGGQALDTSRCFMGWARFSRLIELLPPNLTIIGIDEKTGLVIDPRTGECEVVGLGGVTLIHTGQPHEGAFSASELQDVGLEDVALNRQGHVHYFNSSESFSLNQLGPFRVPQASSGLAVDIWQHALEVQHAEHDRADAEVRPPPEVLHMVQQREKARDEKDWPAADRLRAQLERLGWRVKDTQAGSVVERYDPENEG